MNTEELYDQLAKHVGDIINECLRVYLIGQAMQLYGLSATSSPAKIVDYADKIQKAMKNE